MKGRKMRKSYWRDIIFFLLGTFFGGMVLGFIGSIFRKV
jgi:hypothetical protein